MPLKYYCPKCEKRYVDWGAEKLGFKCPACDGETLFRVGTQPDGEAEAPALSKSAAKRKTKVVAKSGGNGDPFDSTVAGAAAKGDDDLDADVNLDDGDSEAIGDSLAIEDDD